MKRIKRIASIVCLSTMLLSVVAPFSAFAMEATSAPVSEAAPIEPSNVTIRQLWRCDQ